MIRAWAEFAATQWRRAGMGQRTGLDYTSVQGALTSHWPRTWKRLFAGIRAIEHALLGVDAERMAADDHAH